MADEQPNDDKQETKSEGGGWFAPLLIGVGVTVVGGIILETLKRNRERREGIVGYAPIRAVRPPDAGWDF